MTYSPRARSYEYVFYTLFTLIIYMQNKNIFYIFGILQTITLGLIVFFMLGITDIGRDTSLVLSVLFPLSTLIVEYIIYSKK